jgi:hypothetical protein
MSPSDFCGIRNRSRYTHNYENGFMVKAVKLRNHLKPRMKNLGEIHGL